MLPFSSLIQLSDDSKLPVYLKIANAIIEQISQGTVLPGMRLPSSRALAEMLHVHRKTVISAYDELYAQGWIETRSTQGTFVNNQLPIIQPIALGESIEKSAAQTYHLHEHKPLLPYRFDDGYPDIRISPLAALGREYSSLLKDRKFTKLLTYTSNFFGDIKLREQVALHLRDTRGIHATKDQILIGRGSIMIFYLILAQYLSKGGRVIVGNPSYQTFNQIVQHQGGQLIEIPVDHDGMQVDEIERICQEQAIEFVYVIPHHHHPTTVTLSPERRIQLLELAKKYQFRIIEDDYDFDFHFESSPYLPLTSLNHQGRVIYVGSFSKTIGPSLRLSFVVATTDLLDRLAQLRRLIDRTGDPVLERAVARLIEYGEIRRHLNKAWRAYRDRRDLLCGLFASHLSGLIEFQVPEGGLAIWGRYTDAVNIDEVCETAAKEELYVPHPTSYPSPSGRHARFGYSSMNEGEIRHAFGIFRKILKQEPSI